MRVFYCILLSVLHAQNNNNLPEEPSLYLPAPQTSFLKSGKVPSTLELHKKTSSKNKVINVKVSLFFLLLLFTKL